MRKHDFLRKIYNKAKADGNDSAIYFAELPEAFRRKGEEGNGCVPCLDLENGRCGICVEHSYYDAEEGDYYTVSELFWLEKVKLSTETEETEEEV